MKLEYLHKDDSYKNEIPKLLLDEKITLEEKEKNGLYLFSFTIVGENEESAKYLCEMKEQITTTFQNNMPFLLTDEAGEYFNKRLYPYFNKFERLLRKVLFLVSIKENNSSALEIAKKLETSDFGEIYESIFTSKTFREEVKLEVVKNSNNIFSKSEIIEKIKNMKEETIWNKMFAGNYEYISTHFLEIKNYRNDIMHAHNISYATYTKALKLIEKANSELENIISSCLSENLTISSGVAKMLGAIILALGTFAVALNEVVKEGFVNALSNALESK